ncbi:unnamed protein product, partial [Staurois parvus]
MRGDQRVNCVLFHYVCCVCFYYVSMLLCIVLSCRAIHSSMLVL